MGGVHCLFIIIGSWGFAVVNILGEYSKPLRSLLVRNRATHSLNYMQFVAWKNAEGNAVAMTGMWTTDSEAEVKVTIYPENTHEAWTSTYQNQEVYDWLLSKSL